MCVCVCVCVCVCGLVHMCVLANVHLHSPCQFIFCEKSTNLKNFSTSELRIIWDLRRYAFYGSVPYQSKDSCMYHKQSMEIIIRAPTSGGKVNMNG